MQSRFRSKAAWIATFSLVVFILKTYFKIEIPEVDKLVDLILAAATVWGVFNNPTDPTAY
jgi:uncharacterized membrane protein